MEARSEQEDQGQVGVSLAALVSLDQREGFFVGLFAMFFADILEDLVCLQLALTNDPFVSVFLLQVLFEKLFEKIY